MPKTETTEREPEFIKFVTEEDLRYDESPPTPTISSISDDGIVKIRFNSTLQIEALLTEEEKKSFRRRQLAANTVMGEANTAYSNYTKIHDSSVIMNGIAMPSLAISIEPAEPDNDSKCSQRLNFKWTVIGATPTELTLKLAFDWPSCVSSSTSDGDFLVVKFND